VHINHGNVVKEVKGENRPQTGTSSFNDFPFKQTRARRKMGIRIKDEDDDRRIGNEKNEYKECHVLGVTWKEDLG